jgi:hypothetical protein
MDLKKQIIELSNIRKIFHSEADFQFALAWQIQKTYPEAEVRLEYCPSGTEKAMHIDILVIIDGNWFPIELKYKTLKCTKIWNYEKFNLKSHGAQDLGRYDFLNDVKRIEYLSKVLPEFKEGYSVLITNDSSYWKTPKSANTVYHQFRLCEDTKITGVMCWAEHAGEGTIKGRKEAIDLKNTYCAKWESFSKIDDSSSGEFKYLIF